MKVIGYCYHSVNVIRFRPTQSDHIKRLPLQLEISDLTAWRGGSCNSRGQKISLFRSTLFSKINFLYCRTSCCIIAYPTTINMELKKNRTSHHAPKMILKQMQSYYQTSFFVACLFPEQKSSHILFVEAPDATLAFQRMEFKCCFVYLSVIMAKRRRRRKKDRKKRRKGRKKEEIETQDAS